jgi:hypothetical protein
VRHPQLVVWERDGRLAGQLAPLAAQRRWALREARQVEACVRSLGGSGPAVLVARFAPAAADGPALVQRVAREWPAVRIVAVGEADGPPGLAALAWDLGADFALFAPVPLTLLPEVVAGLMGGHERPADT